MMLSRLQTRQYYQSPHEKQGDITGKPHASRHSCISRYLSNTKEQQSLEANISLTMRVCIRN